VEDGDNPFTRTNLIPSPWACSLLLLRCSACVKKIFIYGIFCRSTAYRFASAVHYRETNALPSARIPVLKAEQRIALFRSFFRGHDDVYAVRWENTDGRSGYMPKADRDWKAYLRAKDEDRKKVDRQTRKF
jgi:hypothetical protein